MCDPNPSPDAALLGAIAIADAALAGTAARPLVRAFFDEATFTVSYVVRDPRGEDGVRPGLSASRLGA